MKLRATFAEDWVAMLWHAMRVTGKGYRIPSLRHTGKGTDRRKDKLETAEQGVPRWAQRYRERHT